MQLCHFQAGIEHPLFLIAGPCVIESRELAFETAGVLQEMTRALGIPFIYKSSFDKANRSSGTSFRGPGMDEGLKILDDVRRQLGVPVLTDVHETGQAREVAAVVDVLRIAKFLPGDRRESVTGLIDDYIREVVENEWPFMATGRWSLVAENQLEALIIASVELEASTDQLGVRRAAEELRRYAQNIERARDDRLLIARSPGIMSAKGAVVLMLLFVAACVLCELHLSQRRPLVLSMLLFSLSFGATLYLIVSFDRPFMGTNQIQPESLSLLLIRG